MPRSSRPVSRAGRRSRSPGSRVRATTRMSCPPRQARSAGGAVDRSSLICDAIDESTTLVGSEMNARSSASSFPCTLPATIGCRQDPRNRRLQRHPTTSAGIRRVQRDCMERLLVPHPLELNGSPAVEPSHVRPLPPPARHPGPRGARPAAAGGARATSLDCTASAAARCAAHTQAAGDHTMRSFSALPARCDLSQSRRSKRDGSSRIGRPLESLPTPASSS